MDNETQSKLNELIDLLESHGFSVTATEMKEYGRGDPTSDDYTVTGAEIDVTAFISLDNEIEDDENPFRIK